MLLTTKSTLFWNVIVLCSLEEVYQCFRGHNYMVIEYAQHTNRPASLLGLLFLP
jgi:hypothetical protein